MVQRSLPRPQPLVQAAEALKRGEKATVHVGDSIHYLMFVIRRLEHLTGGIVDFSFGTGDLEQRHLIVWLKGEGDAT